MPTRRDWAATLRPASIRGIPFEVDEETIRDILRQSVHEIPNGTWTIERLGQGATEISLRGYVYGDTVDAKAAAIGAAFKSDLPGLLILPTVGPILVAPIEATRDRSANKHGYVGLTMRFVVKPQALSGISTNFLANGIFTAAAAMVTAIVAQTAAVVRTTRQPAHVVHAAVTGFQANLGALDAIRAAARSEAAAETAVAVTSLGFRVYEVARDTTRSALLDDFAEAAVALGYGMDSAAAIQSFRPLRDVTAPEPASSAPSALATTVNLEALASLARVTALAVEAEALARADFTDQDATETARRAFAGRVEAEIAAISVTAQRTEAQRSVAVSAISALSQTRRAVVDYLNALLIDQAPRVTVEVNAHLPAIVWAWMLYADPSRSQALARANRARRPAVMPLRFRAETPTVTIASGP